MLRKFAKGKNTDVKDSGIQNCVIYTRVSSKGTNGYQSKFRVAERNIVMNTPLNINSMCKVILVERMKVPRAMSERSLTVCLNL
jgi:hypothetical protein